MVRKRHAGGMGMAGRKKTFVAKEAEVVIDFVDLVFGAMTQSRLDSVTMTRPGLSGVVIAQSNLASVTLVS